MVFAARAKTTDLPELGKWADGVSNKGALDWSMLTAMAHRVVPNDPLLTIEWAATLSRGRDSVNDRIADQWNDLDPKACSEWVSTRPASNGRNRSISGSFYQRVSQDLEGGKAFLATMKPSLEKDFALAGFSSGLSGRAIPARSTWHVKFTMPRCVRQK